MATTNALNNQSAPFTVTAGDLTVTAGDILLAQTNLAGTQGIVKIGGFNFMMSGVDGRTTFLGLSAGNTTLSGISNTAIGWASGANLNAAAGSTFLGAAAGNTTVNGNENTGLGNAALNGGDLGDYNTSVGSQCTGNGTKTAAFIQNTYVGRAAGFNATTANNNTVLGFNGIQSVDTGSYNVAIGSSVGANYTGSESSNILINSGGVVGESNVLRIGSATGPGTQQLNKAFICGIDGVNVGSVAKVLTMASDQLGTATITAGTGIAVTPGANTITISSSGTTTLTYTNVNTTPYVVAANDQYIGVDVSVAPITLQFPNAPAQGRVFIVKDFGGNAATNNITLTSVGGAIGFDGALSYVMNTNLQSVQLLFDGTNYQIF